MAIKAVILDDHKLFSAGIKSLLAESHELQIACYADHEFGLSQLDTVQPELIISDLHFQDYASQNWISDFSNYTGRFKFLILSGFSDYLDISLCLKAGVRGYVLKEKAFEELERAVERILAGGVYFSEEIQEIHFKSMDQTPFRTYGLTEREGEVLRLLCLDKTPKDIGQLLNLSRKTVDIHKRNLCQKLNLQSMTQLVKFAIQNKIISL